MQLKQRLVSWTAVAALGAASLFGARTAAVAHGRGRGGIAAFLSTYLNLTDAQKTQAQSIFQDARKSAEPVRQQMRQTRESLRAAVRSGDTAQIQQYATTEGSEIGQLTAIRSSAFAKVYQMLTPEQQQKLSSLEQARRAGRAARVRGAQN